MKISITIQDLEVTEAEKILSQLGGTPRTIGQVIRDIPREEDNKVNVPFTPPAPQAPVQQPQTQAGEDDDSATGADVTGQVDARGFTWDARIHSGNKKMTDKGVWQKRRGVQQAETDAVEAELRGAQQQQAPAAPAAPAFMPSAQTFTPPAPQAPAAPAFVPPPQQAAPAPAAPPVAQPPATPAPAPVRDYQGLMNTISALFGTGSITPDYLNTLTGNIGAAYQTQLNAITDIASLPHMVEYAFQLLQADGKIA